MTSPQFNNARDANTRLQYCVVFFENQWVYVRDVSTGPDGQFIMYYMNLEGPRQILEKDITNLRIPFPSAKLGYYTSSFGDNARFLQRAPSRVYKNGFCASNVVIKSVDGDTSYVSRDMLTNEDFIRCIRGQYSPDLEIISKIPLRSITPISRNYALERSTFLSYALLHKNDLVGEYSDSVFYLYKDCEYKKEGLENMLALKKAAKNFSVEVLDAHF